MTDLRTALRRLNDAAHEALRAARNDPSSSLHVRAMRIWLARLSEETERLVDNAETKGRRKP